MSRIARAEPGNEDLRHAMAVIYGAVAAINIDKKQNKEALDALRNGKTILAQLIARHPDKVEWKREAAQFDGWLSALKK